jgi:tRNA(Ile)-lysidine synthase
MDLLHRFTQHINQAFPSISPKNARLILAVSGGADSVVLTDLMHKNGYDFWLAHCNFQLRGEESTGDEKFVKTLADKYGKEFKLQTFDTVAFAKKEKLSVEGVARKLRYDWFEKLRQTRIEQNKISLIVTGHHADDNIETLLMKFFRGTGIKGLTGIADVQKDLHIIRPLLHFSKEEILCYAKENGLEFVTDSTNLQNDYTRNYFRNELIPKLKTVYPKVENNLLNNLERFKEIEILYDESIQQKKSSLLEQTEQGIAISCMKLEKMPAMKTIVREIVKDFGFSAAQTGEIVKLLHSDTGSYIASSTHRIVKARKKIIITPLASKASFCISIDKDETPIIFPNGKLTLKKIDYTSTDKIPNDENIAMLDAKNIDFPLLLRKRKPGDYFYPLGMSKKQKLSKFLIAQKLSLPEKENVWILESKGKVLWVAGYRIDNRFKITNNTKEILKISFSG